MIIAHRGYSKKFKENTIAAFDSAFQNGADAIETDVRLTKDKKAVINHDDDCFLDGKKIKISKMNLSDIFKYHVKKEDSMLTMEELFDYINKKNIFVFLEIKDNSKLLFDLIIKQIQKYNLWNKVYLLGFANRIKTSLSQQKKYPKLRVCQIIKIPYFSFIKKPKKSYAIFFGWLDEVKFSKQLFRILVPRFLLRIFKKRYEKQGFKVMAGVVNDKKGFKFFHDQGFRDIFTDEIELCHKLTRQF